MDFLEVPSESCMQYDGKNHGFDRSTLTKVCFNMYNSSTDSRPFLLLDEDGHRDIAGEGEKIMYTQT